MSEHATDFVGAVDEAIRSSITAKLPDALVVVAGGGGHYTIEVVSAAFAGKSRLERHRLVNSALAAELKDKIHALAITAYAPDEKPA